MQNPRPLRLLALLALLPAALAAQPPSATMRPGLLADYEIKSWYSSKENLDRGATRNGEASVTHFGLSLSSRHAVSPTTQPVDGLAYATYELDAAGAALPDRLGELSLNLGVIHRLSPTWTLAGYARPGFYSDFESFDADAVNVPVLLLATYVVSPELVWSFGLNASAFSDNPVLPIVGLRWQFARDWTFALGFPQSGFTREINDTLALRLGASFAGGNFRVTRNLGVPAPGVPRLANTYLDFTEIRVGLGADLALGGDLKLALDVGAVTDRKFDYFDRNYRLDSDTGFFAALSLRGAF